MVRPRSRSAFSLIEVLVVTAILGVLVGLLLPAVQLVREATHRVECANHVKQLCLAACAHENVWRFYPSGGWSGAWTGEPTRANGRHQPGGWVFQILDFVEQSNMRHAGAGMDRSGQLKANSDTCGIQLSLLLCPSRAGRGPHATPGTYLNTAPPPPWKAVTDYAACAGSDLSNEPYTAPATLAKGDDPSWWARYGSSKSWNGVCFQRSTVRATDIRAGTSNTYFAGEKYLNPLAYSTGTDEWDDEACYIGMDNTNTRCTYYPPQRDRPGAFDGVRFGSAHAAGLHMGYCDGHVSLVLYSVDPLVHQAAGSRAGRN
jgi:prepilin-type N-terminal cleavage/methylation domain-containing protein/prepilin-type processing-associated H-X9-DG protein